MCGYPPAESFDLFRVHRIIGRGRGRGRGCGRRGVDGGDGRGSVRSALPCGQTRSKE
jgi:hypothetical protein